MGLFAPWFLAGLAGVALPLYLHLLKKLKTTPRPVPSLMFFESRTQSSTHHKRLRYYLLLALRLAVLVLLAIAFYVGLLVDSYVAIRLFGTTVRDIHANRLTWGIAVWVPLLRRDRVDEERESWTGSAVSRPPHGGSGARVGGRTLDEPLRDTRHAFFEAAGGRDIEHPGTLRAAVLEVMSYVPRDQDERPGARLDPFGAGQHAQCAGQDVKHVVLWM